MKPSKRIFELIGETSSDPEFHEQAIKAIIIYLDEEYEMKNKTQTIKNGLFCNSPDCKCDLKKTRFKHYKFYCPICDKVFTDKDL